MKKPASVDKKVVRAKKTGIVEGKGSQGPSTPSVETHVVTFSRYGTSFVADKAVKPGME